MRARRYRPTVIGWTTALLLILGASTNPGGIVAGACEPWDEICRAVERDTILSLVRQHRAAASPDFQHAIVDAIQLEALRAEVDPLLVASIVAKESSFRTRVVSHKGAVGLMQLRPFVARDVSKRADVNWAGVETLNSPQLNVRLGVSYYKELVDRFEGDVHKALTAYNYGPTRVARQLRQGTYRNSSYAREILDLYSRLRGGPVRAASDRT